MKRRVGRTRGREPLEAPRQRRRFSTEYKLTVLAEADACTERGELQALLRREGLDSSLIAKWRAERDAGVWSAPSRGRRRKSEERDPLAERVAQLERERRELRERLARAEIIIATQRRVARSLGVPLEEGSSEESE